MKQTVKAYRWANFKQLAESLRRRELTGHAARDAIKLAMDVSTQAQWNDFYRRILNQRHASRVW
jgi:DNA ligase 1